MKATKIKITELNDKKNELSTKKNKINKRMVVVEKEQSRLRVTKKLINKELNTIRQQMDLLLKEKGEDAVKEQIRNEINNIDSGDVFPEDLDKEFDLLEYKVKNTRKEIDINDFLVNDNVVVANNKKTYDKEEMDDLDENIKEIFQQETNIDLGFSDEDIFIDE